MNSANSYALSLTWTNGSDSFTSTTAWQTNTSTGLDPVGLTNIDCVAVLPSGSTFVTNCVGGNGSPSSGDSTIFTNSTSYTVKFSGDAPDYAPTMFTGSTGVVTLDMGSFTWGLTNQILIGRGVNSTATVYVAGGTLGVFNGDNNANLRIGAGITGLDFASGALFVTNGTVIYDTMNVGTITNSSGKLVISGLGVVTNTIASSTIFIGGGASTGNKVIITNGGKMFAQGELRIGHSGVSNSLCLVSGTGSYLQCDNNIRVGAGGARGNMLIVSNGAMLVTANGGSLGANGGGNAFNTGIVVGAGSKWISRGGALPSISLACNGGGSTGNVLQVYDGGLVSVSNGNIQVCTGAPALSNKFNMGGTGLMSTGQVDRLLWGSQNGFSEINFTNSFFTAKSIEFSRGTNGTATIYRDATVLVAGDLNTNVVINNILVSETNNALLINGGLLNGQSGSNRFGMTVGNRGLLVVTNGGKLLTELGTLGGGSALSTTIVTGVGSVWSNAGPLASGMRTNVLIVGTNSGGGTNNYLAVLNGGSLFDSGALLIGNSAAASNNTVALGGPGAASTVTIQGTFHVGASRGTSFNRATVSNATVNCANINVGNSTLVDQLFTFTTNDIDAALVVTNFCGSTNGLVSTVLTNCSDSVSTNPVFNTLTVDSGTITGGLITVYGTNTIVYNGGAIQFATLQVDGNMTGTAALSVPSGSTLSGVGSVANAVTIDGTLAPGDSPGTLTISNNLVLNSGATLDYELGTSSDLTVVTGNLTLDGTINISDSGGFGVGNYTLITYAGTLANNGLTVGTTPNPSLSYAIVAGGGSVVLQVTAGGPSYATWASSYGLSGGSAVGTADPDGDGMINTNEFLAGFNPTNNSAYVHVISAAKSSTNIVVTYLGANGDSTYTGGPTSRTNVLEFTTGTANGSYSNNFASTGQTNILSGGTGLGIVTSFVDTNGASGATKYYRIRVLVP